MIGFGYDIHRLEYGRKFILGGIEISSDIGPIAHSDGDVLIHSIIDSILGACSLGDIGEMFPDTDNKYKNISSVELLKEVLDKINQKFRIINIDCMIILEKPKLKEYKIQIKENISKILNLDISRVNIKAGTNEKIDALGRNEACAVYSVCQVEEIN
jgi:2-C-methyl-D-erythritol 2,4-cyclodiphosphate synthase